MMRKFLLALTALIGLMTAAAVGANYTMTQGSGTTFGSVVVGGVNYVQMLLCDLTTPSQCAAVSAGGAVKVDNSAVTQPVSNAGTFPAQLTGATNDIRNVAGTVSLPTGAATAAKQPALGTAGTPSSDVLSVQGAPSMTPLNVQTSDPCLSAAKSSAAINVTSATTTSLVAVSGSTTVYVCGISLTIAPSATSADTALFEYGTGAACTSPTALTGTYGNGDLTSAAGVAAINYGNGGATIFKSAASAGVCILTAGTAVSVQGVLTYVQQ